MSRGILIILLIAFLSASLVGGCRKALSNEGDEALPYYLEIPAGFPQPPIPSDNPLTAEKIALGKRLFFDPILSRDSSVSCSSCHFQEHAFADPMQFSLGVEARKGERNAPVLFNLAYNDVFMFDGGIPTLDLQVLAPLDAHFEMDFTMKGIIERLQKHPTYPAAFRKVFGTEVSPFGLTRAITAFERTMISGNAPYDQYTYQGEADALSEAARRGMALFSSDSLSCSSCHSGFRFTNVGFEQNGLYVAGQDSGRMRVTLKESDRGKFKVPTLRNIEVSGPYMHDGRFQTLDQVIDHYASGGNPHPNKSPLIRGFRISETEKQDLIAFLHALTDRSFLTNPAFSKP